MFKHSLSPLQTELDHYLYKILREQLRIFQKDRNNIITMEFEGDNRASLQIELMFWVENDCW